PLLLFVIAKGRDYYLAATYPMLYAAGAVWIERGLASLSQKAATVLRTCIWIALLTDAVITAAFFLPIAPINSGWFKVANGLNGDLREEIGWPELVETVAKVRD